MLQTINQKLMSINLGLIFVIARGLKKVQTQGDKSERNNHNNTDLSLYVYIYIHNMYSILRKQIVRGLRLVLRVLCRNSS